MVTGQLGPVSYMVQLENGEMWRRHIDHLRAGSVIPSTEKKTPKEGIALFLLYLRIHFSLLPMHLPTLLSTHN